jgi:molybdopterin molybdotransferase
MIRMASLEQAQALVLARAGARPTRTEAISLTQAGDRRLARPVRAALSQPPADVSAMDGYAVRFADMRMGARLSIIGESRAGKPYEGAIGANEAVRIFTGAWTPMNADHILIQEEATRETHTLVVAAPQPAPASIRRRGRDFSEGDELVPSGFIMTPGAVALAAAGNVETLTVHTRPVVGVLSTGDELAPVGSRIETGRIINSITPALCRLIAAWGADPIDLGTARDDEADVRKRLSTSCDLVVSIGGASVGDYDIVRPAFAAEGFSPVFEKVAVKPGKPTWFSEREDRLALGLPGNPAAAMVTAQLFLRPMIVAMTGGADPLPTGFRAHVTRPLAASGDREELLRAVLSYDASGRVHVSPADDQDSSLLNPFLAADALIRRRPGVGRAETGDLVEILRLL